MSEQPQAVARPTFFERLWSAIAATQRLWISSLRLRVIVIIVVGGTLGAVAIGVAITSQVRNSVFEQAVKANVEQFTAEATSGQEQFSAGSSYTIGEMQQVANKLVATMYDPARGLMGAVLMRSQGQDSSTGQIVEPSTATASTLRVLITQDLRAEVAHSNHIAWQSVGVPLDPADPQSATYPGIVVGAAITIPSSGDYELYAVYSLDNQEDLLDSTYRVLSFGVVALIVLVTLLIVIVLRLVLRPVHEASEGAKHLADGALDTRMKVEGADELAQLATSFNQMAASLEDQFTRMERMSQVQTAFVSAVSHELRSPVTTIRMAGQLIYDKRDELSPALKRTAELQHTQLINLDTMLSDLLEISRYDAGAMNLAAQTADIADIAHKVMEMAQPLADDNSVQMDLLIDGDTMAEVEPRRIERIVRNLVVNALEHAEARPVRVRVIGNATAVAVEVVDHGVGLTEEQAAHVFDRFWRADSSRVRKTGGTGLGLTIAREDALIHGGTLAATGVLGVGAAFLLVVPKKPGARFDAPLKLQAPSPLSETPESLSQELEVTPKGSAASVSAASVEVPAINAVTHSDISQVNSSAVQSRDVGSDARVDSTLHPHAAPCVDREEEQE